MKKIKFEKKLDLKKETVSNLNELQMKNVKGGNLASDGGGVCLSFGGADDTKCW